MHGVLVWILRRHRSHISRSGAVLLQVFGDNLSWDIRLFVWHNFHFCCGTALSSICVTYTTVFPCYGFHFIYICMPGVFRATEKDTTQHGCVIVLLWFSFLCGS